MTAPTTGLSVRRLPPGSRTALNAMTVDVEDYFQVQAFADIVPRSSWDEIPRRVEANVDNLLELFDAHGTRATFFTLGWIAERHPQMVRRIADAGHELASHGYDHTPADRLTPAQFRDDIRRSKYVIEEIASSPVLGYRAPTFSIGARNQWAYEILAGEGYRYSSSTYPIRHDLYGDVDGMRTPFEACERFWEIPLTTRRLLGQNIPSAGGGYFRLVPYWIWRRNLLRLNTAGQSPCIFYFHPWEIDPAQPRIRGIGLRTRFRHYTNLRAMPDRLVSLLSEFRWVRMDEAFRSLIDVARPDPVAIAAHA
jgi:polysaccharide deacetylase family protein (PEP-CTERM system associated)